MQERFRRFAERTTAALGSVWAFAAAVAFTILWGASGLVVGFSDTWQLTMNTVASIVAFLMVFVIQNTQSRDARAIHLKLDELLRSMDGARQHLVEVESLSDREMEELREEFRAIHERAVRDGGRARRADEAPPHPGAGGAAPREPPQPPPG
ncbi:MAG TPA: low affinity iron permease family protein [Longimicrobiales bacterium]